MKDHLGAEQLLQRLDGNALLAAQLTATATQQWLLVGAPLRELGGAQDSHLRAPELWFSPEGLWSRRANQKKHYLVNLLSEQSLSDAEWAEEEADRDRNGGFSGPLEPAAIEAALRGIQPCPAELIAWREPQPDEDDLLSDGDHPGWWVPWSGLLLTAHASPWDGAAEARAWMAAFSPQADQSFDPHSAAHAQWLAAFPDALQERCDLRRRLSVQAQRKIDDLIERLRDDNIDTDIDIEDAEGAPSWLGSWPGDWHDVLEEATAQAWAEQSSGAPCDLGPRNFPWATLACDLYLALEHRLMRHRPSVRQPSPPAERRAHDKLQQHWIWLTEIAFERLEAAEEGRQHWREPQPVSRLCAALVHDGDEYPDALGVRLKHHLAAVGHELPQRDPPERDWGKIKEELAGWPRWLRSWYSPVLSAELDAQLKAKMESSTDKRQGRPPKGP